MFKRRAKALAVAIGSCVFLWQCGGGAPAAPTAPPGGGGGGGGTPQIPPALTTAVVLAAGDVGECGFGALQTGALLDRLPAGPILALGDLAYMQGTTANFRDCYDPAWGRHLDRTRPVPGNHEYETPGAQGYFDYFGGLAGPRGLGYYAFDAGPWRIIALNSELPKTPGTPQNVWLRNELTSTRAQCTLAYFHRPLFTSGPNKPNVDIRDLWRVLDEFGVDVVLSGHDHLYERFAPQDIDGRPKADGIRQFVVGTGGAHSYGVLAAQPNSEVRASVYGILVLTLSAGAYQWDFASTTSFRDTNSDKCH